MKLSNWKTLASLSIGVIALSGCTQLIVLFKPSAELDPMPTAALEDKPAVVKEQEVADPMLDQQWALKAIGVTAETLKTPALAGNANVKIAILSTGVDYNHEDLQGQIYINK